MKTTATELAARINGREYRSELTKQDAEDAKESGLVVILGRSDDLVSLEGALDEEISAYEGTKFAIGPKGILADVNNVDRDDYEALERHGALDFVRRSYEAGVKIEAHWSKYGFAWVIEASAPHSTFEINDDGEPFCRGIVMEIPQAAESIEARHAAMVHRLKAKASDVRDRVRVMGVEEAEYVREAFRTFIEASAILDRAKKILFYGRTLADTKEIDYGPEAPVEGVSDLSDSDIDLLHAVIGLATEDGELLEAMIPLLRGEGLDVPNLLEEFGDNSFYGRLGMDAARLERAQVLLANIRKLEKRYGKGEWSQEREKNRDLEGERKILEEHAGDSDA